MKKLVLTLVFSLLTLQGTLLSQTPIVQEIINQTNIDSLIFFVEELSGEVQTIINGSPYTIVSRHKNNQVMIKLPITFNKNLNLTG